MADVLNLINQTIIDSQVLTDVSTDINLIIKLFEALGGIFIIGIIITIWNILQQKKQQRLLREITKKLDKLSKKR